MVSSEGTEQCDEDRSARRAGILGQRQGEKLGTHLIEAESATLGKLVERVVDGGRSLPFPRAPFGSETCTSRELIAELTPVKRPVPVVVVGTVDADGGAILRIL